MDDHMPSRLREEPFASLAQDERQALAATFKKQQLAAESWKTLFDPASDPALIFIVPERARD